MDAQAIIQSIIMGQHDDDLDGLKAATERRTNFLQEARVLGAREGDVITFSDNIRPAYLAGKTATVKGITRGKRNSMALSVSLTGGRVGRFSGDLTVPASLVAKVERPDV